MTTDAKTTETKKTQMQRAEDVAYTINHALACTATDVLSPYIGNFTQTYLGKRMEVGCGHDHSHGHEHDHDHHDHSHATPPKSNLKHWWIGELVGDFGAVPLTVAVQRFSPGFMHGLRRVAEPVLAPLFRRGARRSARIWAVENGVSVNSAEARAQENSIYEREMSHLPQAFVWTFSSTALNIAAQRVSGNKGELAHLIAGKLAGSATSAALVVGFRGLAPHQAYRFDRFTSRHIFEPATRALTGDSTWQERVSISSKAGREV